MKQSYQRQGGWVASFIIVAVLLVAALIAGVYYVKTHQQPLATTDPSTVETAINDSRQTDSATKSDDSKKSNADSQSQSTTNRTNDARQSSAKNDNSTKSSAEDTKIDDSAAKNTPTESSRAASRDLPATGPADTALALVAFGSLTFAALSYVRSRQLA